MDRSRSRKKTPWDGETELTSTQEFLRRHYERYYADRHRAIGDSSEAELINAYVPAKCPLCASETFKKSGHTKSGIQRYMCG